MHTSNLNIKKIQAGDYTVYCGKSALKLLAGIVSGYKKNGLFILVDEHTETYCMPIIKATLKGRSLIRGIIKIKSGEHHKNIETCKIIWQQLSNFGASRKSLLINLGGGIICDIGGFAASSFKRGIDYLNIPTTLLAQVDASVGGKTGVNFNNIKNQIGAFSNPKAVFINPGFLNTLDRRHLLSGFAEVIKHGLIADTELWTKLRKTNPLKIDPSGLFLEEIIIRSVEIKNEIVKNDPYESGVRKILNFGHTVGHAIETNSFAEGNNTLLHGEAIAAGMICESYLSVQKTGMNKDKFKEISDYISRIYKPAKIDNSDLEKLIAIMMHDKKNEGNKINMTLLKNTGQAVTDIYCSANEIKNALSAIEP